MDILADSLSFIKPSPTMVVTQRAEELRAQGVDIVSLSAGEPDFPTPEPIIEAAKRAMDEGETRYTPASGTAKLRAAVARQSEKSRHVPCSADRVIVTSGAKHAISEFFQAVLNPEDEVVIPAPYWVSYPDQVRLFGGIPVFAESTSASGFLLDPKEFKRLLTPKTKVLVLNTPNNPTGAVYPSDRIHELVDVAAAAGIILLCDEVYRDLVYGSRPHVSPLTAAKPEQRDKIFVVDGVSKSHAMTGWRIGWGIGHPEIIAAMGKVQSQSTSNPSSISQAAALAAVESKAPYRKPWNKAYAKQRNLLCKGLNEIDGVQCAVPDGAFYVFPSVKGVLEKMGPSATDVTLATFLLEEGRTAVVPGSAFGAPGHLRLAYAASQERLQEAVQRIKYALARI